MKLAKIIARTALWTIGGTGILLIALFSLLAYVQTEPGKRRLADWLAASMSSPDTVSVRVGRIEGYIPFILRLDRLEISDNEGRWLAASNLTCRISPSALLRGRLDFKTLGAAVINVQRFPQTAPDPDGGKAQGFSMPESLPPARIEHLRVGRLVLGETIFGERAVFAIRGRLVASAENHEVSSFLRLHHLEGPAAQAEIAATLQGREPSLALNAEICDCQGRFAGRFLDGKPPGSTTVRLRGGGPLTRWSGHLSARAANLGSIDARLAGSWEKGKLRMRAHGPLQVNRAALPERLLTVEGLHAGQFRLDIEYGDQAALVLHQAELETALASVTLAGRHNLQDRSLSFDFRMHIENLARFRPLIQPGISGRADISGRISGTIPRPEAELRINLFEPAYDRYRASRLAADMRIVSTAPLQESLEHLRITSKGEVRNPEHGVQNIPALDKLNWALIARVENEKQISVEMFEARCEMAAVEGSGRVDLNRLDFEADTVVLIPQLHPLSDTLKTEVKGKARLHYQVQGNFKEKRLSAAMDGRLEELDFGDLRLATLFGRSLRSDARLIWRFPHHLELKALQVASPVLQANDWEGFIDLASGAMQGQGQIRIPSLKAVSGIVGREVQGPLNLALKTGGTLASPRVKAEATSPRIVLGGLACRGLAFTVEGEDLRGGPRGRFEASLEYEKQDLTASGMYALDDNRVHLSSLRLDAAGARLQGELGIQLSPVLILGTISGKAEDLDSLSPLLGERVQGDGLLEARFTQGELPVQNIHLEFASRALAMRRGDFRDIKIKCQMDDVFGTPSGRAAVAVARFASGDLILTDASVTAEGKPGRFAFRTQASGRLRELFEIMAGGVFVHDEGRQRLDISTVTGRFGSEPFELGQPLKLIRQNRRLSAEEAVLNIGTGLWAVSGSLDASRIDLETRFESIPIRGLHAFGAPDLAGTASGQARIAGPLSKPRANLAMEIADVRQAAPAYEHMPPVTLKTKASLDNGLLRAELDLLGPGDAPVTARLAAPVAFSLSPFGLEPVRGGELKGSVKASLPLGSLKSYFQMEGHELAGRWHTDLALLGTLHSPRLTGTMAIEEGLYQYSTAGTVLSAIEIALVTDGDRITVKTGRAADGSDGRVQMTGWLKIDPAAKFPLQLDIDLKQANLIRRDDLAVTTSGKLQLTGTLAGPLCRGVFGIEQAELRIPDRLPPDIVPLEVTEVNAPVEAAGSKTASPSSKGLPLVLDLAVDIPGRAFVRGRGLDSEWKGRLEVTGTPASPALSGDLAVVRGHFFFFDKRFTLTEGSLRFEGAAPPAPRFDVTAEYQRKDLTAYVDFSGTPEDPRMNLRSDPAYPSDEILARILFGRSVSGVTPVQALKLANAMSALSGGGSAFDLMDRTRKSIGIDTLDIRRAEGEEGKTAAAAGKYLGEDVYMEVEKGLDDESGKASVELELTPNITVESEVGTDASGGVGLNWKWDY